MKEFQFDNKKMGRDAERKYIEINKYPKAGFTGKIIDKVDFDKPGSYEVRAKGKLTIHGVTKEITEKGTVIVSKGQIKLVSAFDVRLKDYNIDTPSILGYEMTDDAVKVKMEAKLEEATGISKK